MDISMAICTYNRCDMLKDAVQSLLRQSVVEENRCRWEIIVVDNNSTDGTADYLRELAETQENVKILFEKRQGVGYARNAALRGARYDVIAYIDDDETADENWAAEILRVFEENDNVGCVSGPYHLEEKSRIPKWFPEEMYGIIGEIKNNLKGDATDYCDAGRSDCASGNMAVHRSVLEKGIAFRPIGRRGDLLLGGEDVMMVRDIYDAGFRHFYAPRAKIYHKFIPERATVGYAIRFYRGLAYGKAEKRKMPYYFFCLLARCLLFPFRLIFDCRKSLYHLVRLCYEYYRLEAAFKMLFHDSDG